MTTLIAQQGYTFFSYDPNVYKRIASNSNDTRNIYLEAFMRGKNRPGGMDRAADARGELEGNIYSIPPLVLTR
jgi:hypothetical protein